MMPSKRHKRMVSVTALAAGATPLFFALSPGSMLFMPWEFIPATFSAFLAVCLVLLLIELLEKAMDRIDRMIDATEAPR